MLFIPYINDNKLKMIEIHLLEDKTLPFNKEETPKILLKNLKRDFSKGNIYSLFSLDIDIENAIMGIGTRKYSLDEIKKFFSQFYFEYLKEEIDLKPLTSIITQTESLNIREFKNIRNIIKVAQVNTEIINKYSDQKFFSSQEKTI